MAEKLLTGKMIYETAQEVNDNRSRTNAWEDAMKPTQNIYNEVAKRLNQKLGLCESCGNRPADGHLYEVAGDELCAKCIEPPAPKPDDLMVYALEDAQGFVFDSFTLPAGINIEEYKKQLKEQFKDVSFQLLSNNDTKATAHTIAELYKVMQQHLSKTEIQPYAIHILKGHEIIGIGKYKHEDNGDIHILQELNAATGLNDIIFEYAWNYV